MRCSICNEIIIEGNRCNDFYDCVENWEEQNGIRRGTWMIEWMNRVNIRSAKRNESNFVKWSRKVQG